MATNDVVKIISLACDHLIAHRYALYLVSKGYDKKYENAYRGARGELAFFRHLGPKYLADCIVHLERSIAGNEEPSDYRYDGVVHDVPVDVKTSRPLGLKSSLLVKNIRSEVTYVLLEAEVEVRNDPFDACDMSFVYRGASTGDKASFEIAPERFNAPGASVAIVLEGWSWLMKLLGL